MAAEKDEERQRGAEEKSWRESRERGKNGSRKGGYRGAREIQRELGKQINNKAVDFITLLIFAGFDPPRHSSRPQVSPVMLNNT